jgi:hypothetical protein
MDTSLQLANFVTVQVKARRKATKTRVYLENAKYVFSPAFLRSIGEK